MTGLATADQAPAGSQPLYNAIFQKSLFDRGRQKVLVDAGAAS